MPQVENNVSSRQIFFWTNTAETSQSKRSPILISGMATFLLLASLACTPEKVEQNTYPVSTAALEVPTAGELNQLAFHCQESHETLKSTVAAGLASTDRATALAALNVAEACLPAHVLPYLELAVAHPSERVRFEAIDTFRFLQRQRTLFLDRPAGFLRKALTNQPREIYSFALVAQLDWEEASLEALIPHLESSNPLVSSGVIPLLARLPEDEVPGLILKATRSSSGYVRATALDQYGQRVLPSELAMQQLSPFISSSQAAAHVVNLDAPVTLNRFPSKTVSDAALLAGRAIYRRSGGETRRTDEEALALPLQDRESYLKSLLTRLESSQGAAGGSL